MPKPVTIHALYDTIDPHDGLATQCKEPVHRGPVAFYAERFLSFYRNDQKLDCSNDDRTFCPDCLRILGASPPKSDTVSDISPAVD